MPPAKILLVDDRSENLLALEAILESLGQDLVCVRSGEAALAALLSDEFAVILLDVVMPGMDGFETAAHIKRRARTHGVPIIFLTAAGADPEHAFRGYAAGAVDYITKPFDPWVLRSKVKVFVDLYVLRGRQARMAAELSQRLADVEAAAAGLAESARSHDSRDFSEAGGGAAANAEFAQLNDALTALRKAVDALGSGD